MESIESIRHVMYINLDERTDRRQHMEEECRKIFPSCEPIRFSAIQHAKGAIGCTMSHIACLQHAIREDWDHVVICEDDISFLKPQIFCNRFAKAMEKLKSNWDVILLGGNNVGPYVILGECVARVVACQTTTGYLVKKEYMPTLLENFETGLQLFQENLHLPQLYAIDQFWFSLQKRDKWFLIYPLTVTQKPDFSNIEERAVNYNHVMLMLDKSHLYGRAPSLPKHHSPLLNMRLL